MPTIGVVRDELFKAIGETYTEAEFHTLCFEFGVELDDVTSEREEMEKTWADKKNSLKPEQLAELEAKLNECSTDILYKIDVAANRYDLLCVEGIARALRIFLGKEAVPNYRGVTPPSDQIHKMVAKKETQQIRPFVVAAILRNITFTPEGYKSFIDLQDKLHFNICRRRTLVAIGTHDLDTVEGPFSYEALPPDEIKFVPLKEEKEFNGVELFEHYRDPKKNSALKPYLPIIENSPVYPVIYDSKRRVLSLPPIINSEHSKIQLHTKNVFIECTATDYTKAKIVLNTVVAMFSEHCAEKFSYESVQIDYEHNKETHVLPDMKDYVFEAGVDFINRGIGIDISAKRMVELLNRMGLPADDNADGSKLKVIAPPTRSDILHACDILEDVAIGFGYNNIQKTIPPTNTIGKPQPLNKLGDQIRGCVAEAGYTETLTFVLCAKVDNFFKLRREDDGKTAVVLSNPVSKMFDIGRTSLLPGVLNTLASNQTEKLPLRVFELGDVMLLAPGTEIGAKNERHLCGVYGGTTSGLEHIHGLLDRVMEMNDVQWQGDVKEDEKSKQRVYSIRESADPAFMEGRRVDVFLNETKVGVFGILHPQVMKSFDIKHPCSALEINIEPLL